MSGSPTIQEQLGNSTLRRYTRVIQGRCFLGVCAFCGQVTCDLVLRCPNLQKSESESTFFNASIQTVSISFCRTPPAFEPTLPSSWHWLSASVLVRSVEAFLQLESSPRRLTVVEIVCVFLCSVRGRLGPGETGGRIRRNNAVQAYPTPRPKPAP